MYCKSAAATFVMMAGLLLPGVLSFSLIPRIDHGVSILSQGAEPVTLNRLLLEIFWTVSDRILI